MARHAYDCLWYQSGNYSYLLRVAGRSDCAPAHCFMSIFKMRRKFWPRTMTTHLNMLKHLNKEIRRGKQTCKQAGKESSKNASVTKQTWGAKVETAIRMIRLQSNIFKTRNPYSQYMQTGPVIACVPYRIKFFWSPADLLKTLTTQETANHRNWVVSCRTCQWYLM